MRKLLGCLIVLSASASAQAATRVDVLEFGLSDGSQFVLRSEYEWMALPLPVGRHGSRESTRSSWVPYYKDRSGKEDRVPGTVEDGGEALLAVACSYFGMKQGIPLAHFSYRRADGGWLPREQFPMARLDIKVDADDDAARQRTLQQAGVQGAAYHFGLIYAHGRWRHDLVGRKGDVGCANLRTGPRLGSAEFSGASRSRLNSDCSQLDMRQQMKKNSIRHTVLAGLMACLAACATNAGAVGPGMIIT